MTETFAASSDTAAPHAIHYRCVSRERGVVHTSCCPPPCPICSVLPILLLRRAHLTNVLWGSEDGSLLHCSVGRPVQKCAFVDVVQRVKLWPDLICSIWSAGSRRSDAGVTGTVVNLFMAAGLLVCFLRLCINHIKLTNQIS